MNEAWHLHHLRHITILTLLTIVIEAITLGLREL